MSYNVFDYVELEESVMKRRNIWGYLIISKVGDEYVGLDDQVRQGKFEASQIERHKSLKSRLIMAENQAGLAECYPERYNADILRMLVDKARKEYLASK
jgi:hypothetical protein